MQTRGTAAAPGTGGGIARAPNGATGGVFDLSAMESTGPLGKLVGWLLDDPQWLFGLLRLCWPIPYAPWLGWAMVTRFEDVQEVLAQEQIFQVPWSDKMIALNGGKNFILGLQDGADYQRYRRHILEAFRRDDVPRTVTPLAAGMAADIVAGCGGRIDAIEDLITLVPTLICEHYYGVEIANKVEFAHLTIAMSAFLFGVPGNAIDPGDLGLVAGARVRPMIDAAIATAKAAPGARDDVLARLVRMQANEADGPSDEEIRAHLVGMITGFIPTNTIAAGHILEMLLRRPDFMARSRAAALAGDDDCLQRCLFEALRFKPINPGPFRVCRKDYTIANGSSRAKTIRAGTKLLVSTQSAMFDERRIGRPQEFDTERPRAEYLLFGHGLHWCIGAYLAEAQITQTFKALLRRDGLRRAAGGAGQLRAFGGFPAHLVVEFDHFGG